jgi:hypothetical protein
MDFNVFDPSQWADATGFAVVAVVAVLTLVGVFAMLATGTRWADWLDETHGRASVDDPWEDDTSAS